MDAVILRNFRCFREPDPVPLAPLTLLVGENSTGKTTFLAATRLAWRLTQSVETPDFNEKPFLLGAYEQIAHHRGRHGGRVASFEIGSEAALPLPSGKVRHQQLPLAANLAPKDQQLRWGGRFENLDSQPFLAEWYVSSENLGFDIRRQRTDEPALLHWIYPTGRAEAKLFPPIPPAPMDLVGFAKLPFASPFGDIHKLVLKVEGERPSPDVLKQIEMRVKGATQAMPKSVYPSAPIRTRPERTYDPLKDAPEPEGGHVPMILAKSYNEAKWRPIMESLDRFGKASGLFQHLTIKRPGKQESSSFHVMVKLAGSVFNLVDVGYGVSQILPIVVDILRGEPKTMFLLQQPEVHLHPRAQAELGTLLGQLVKRDNKRFVVETHSDYLIDRVRIDVRDGKGLKPKDVIILWFERTNGGVEIHPLRLDEQGNIIDAPPGYRRFFLDEERRFIGG